jgi:hypothetical protein
MIEVVRMVAQYDDVDIDVLGVYPDDIDIRDLYQDVKKIGLDEVDHIIFSKQCQRMPILDMGEYNNLPHASIIEDGEITTQIVCSKTKIS